MLTPVPVPLPQNWMDDQPNNLLDQDCINKEDLTTGKWDDNHCKESKTFVCKFLNTFGSS